MYTCTITFPTKKAFAEIKKQIEVVGGRIIENEKETDAPYDPEFVAKIRESEEQIKNGQYRILKTEDLWK